MFLFFNKNDQIYIDRIALLVFIILLFWRMGYYSPRIITRKFFNKNDQQIYIDRIALLFWRMASYYYS